MANKILKTLNFGGTDVYDLVPNWENVEDRPFGYETPTGGDTLKWDGKTSGLEGVMSILYRVHEATPTAKEGTVEINANGTVTSTPFTVEDKNDGVQFLIANNVAMAVIVPTDGITVDGLKFNKAGIYLRKSGSEYVSALTIKDCEEFTGVKTLDYKYLPKSLRFGSDGVKKIDILPLTTEFVTNDDDGDGVDDMFALPNMLQGIEDGKTYTVTYNGTAYECVAKYYSMEGMAMYVLGNFDLAMGTGDTGEPFVISALTTQEDVESFGTGVAISPLDGSIPTSLAISFETENITPIKTKYLPEHLQFGVEEGSGGTTEILPPTDLMSMDENGEGYVWVCTSLITGIEIGQNYTVNLNGVDYECTVIEESQLLGIPLPFLGNIDALMGTGDNGIPFAMWVIPAELFAQAGYGAAFMTTSPHQSVTISISSGSQTIKKLDNKYLDLDWIPKARKVTSELFNESLDFSSGNSITFQEIKFEIMDGETYRVVWNGEIYSCVGRLTTSNSIAQLYQLGNPSLSLYGEKGEDTGEPFLFEYVMLQGLMYFTYRIKSTSTNLVGINVLGPKLEATPMPSIFAPEIFNKVRTKELEMYDTDFNNYKIYFNINQQMFVSRNGATSSTSNLGLKQIAYKDELQPIVFTSSSMQSVSCNMATFFKCLYAASIVKTHYFVHNVDGYNNVYLINRFKNVSNTGYTAELVFEVDVEGSKVTIVWKNGENNPTITVA